MPKPNTPEFISAAHDKAEEEGDDQQTLEPFKQSSLIPTATGGAPCCTVGASHSSSFGGRDQGI